MLKGRAGRVVAASLVAVGCAARERGRALRLAVPPCRRDGHALCLRHPRGASCRPRSRGWCHATTAAPTAEFHFNGTPAGAPWSRHGYTYFCEPRAHAPRRRRPPADHEGQAHLGPHASRLRPPRHHELHDTKYGGRDAGHDAPPPRPPSTSSTSGASPDRSRAIRQPSRSRSCGGELATSWRLTAASGADLSIQAGIALSWSVSARRNERRWDARGMAVHESGHCARLGPCHTSSRHAGSRCRRSSTRQRPLATPGRGDARLSALWLHEARPAGPRPRLAHGGRAPVAARDADFTHSPFAARTLRYTSASASPSARPRATSASASPAGARTWSGFRHPDGVHASSGASGGFARVGCTGRR